MAKEFAIIVFLNLVCYQRIECFVASLVTKTSGRLRQFLIKYLVRIFDSNRLRVVLLPPS